MKKVPAWYIPDSFFGNIINDHFGFINELINVNMKGKNDLILVFAGTEISVIHLKGELDGNGIAAMVKNDFQSGISAGFMGGMPSAIDLYIRQSDLNLAKPIINEFNKSYKG